MKKLWILMMALVMTMSLVACGKGEESSATAPQVKEMEFTTEQQALAQEFSDMTERFNEIVERVNASPELLSDEELVTTMNELTDEINAADEYFADPEVLTSEVMEGLKIAIEAVNEFIQIAEGALDELDSAKAALEAEAVVVPVEILNITGLDIHLLALSPSGNNEWGENLVTEAIMNEETVEGELAFTEDTLIWDILVEDGSGNQLSFMGVDFSEASTDGAKLVLEATEGGEYIAYIN